MDEQKKESIDFTPGIIAVASKAYPDDLIQIYYEDKKPVGDTLATFLAEEISEVIEGAETRKEALSEAIRAVGRAHQEVGSVLTALKIELWKETQARKRKTDAVCPCGKPATFMDVFCDACSKIVVDGVGRLMEDFNRNLDAAPHDNDEERMILENFTASLAELFLPRKPEEGEK